MGRFAQYGRELLMTATALSLTVALCLSGCSGYARAGKPSGAGNGANAGDVAGALPQELIGHWVTEIYVKFMTMEVNMKLSGDGTGVIGDTRVTWKAENNRLVLLSEKSTDTLDTFTYEASNSSLTLVSNDNYATFYIKKEFLDAINNGFAHKKNKKYDKAIMEFTKAVQMDSISGYAYRFRGLAYLEKGDYAAAIKDFTRALEIDPADAEAEDELERADKLNGGGAMPAILSKLAPFDENDRSIYRDARDGQTYRTVQIGNQTWMAKNLNYKTDGGWCYQDSSVNCKRYGRLYDWNTAMAVCPPGWHLPSREEWDSLMTAVGGERTFMVGGDIFWVGAGTKLKAKKGWESYEVSGNGSDDYGFSALPGAERGIYGDDVSFAGYQGYWWSATKHNSRNTAYAVTMRYDDSFVSESRHDSTSVGLSVRCVQT
jgi:uncharacterized protein (TIGR02145 family)